VDNYKLHIMLSLKYQQNSVMGVAGTLNSKSLSSHNYTSVMKRPLSWSLEVTSIVQGN